MRTNIRDDLHDNVFNNLNNIDFSDLDQMATNLGSGGVLFGGYNFTTMIGRILTGEFATDYPNMFAALLSIAGGAILQILPIIAMIVGAAVLTGFIQNLRSDKSGEGVQSVIHFTTLAVIVTLVMFLVADLTMMATGALASMKAQMDIIFPILLTMMATVGGHVSVGVYQPAVLMLSNGVMQIFSYVIMPIFIITLVFNVIGNLSSTTKYDRFNGFFQSLYKWILGITFTVFLGFLSIQGLVAATHDGISIRAAKFTMSSYVPFLGGYLSQGFDLIMASSVLIKNATGMAGLYLLLGVVLGPIIKIAVVILALKLAAAITQPFADQRISNFLNGIVKSFSMLAAVLIGASFMYFITIGLVMLTGNVLR
ncbi:MAG: stage III sporulation protein AE [Firmicutes bacterium]|nr:stage III sporulation protein AE [Bacillota bacterium]